MANQSKMLKKIAAKVLEVARLLGGRRLRRFAIVNVGRRWISLLAKPSYAEFDGFKFFLDPVDGSSGLFAGDIMADYLKQTLKLGDVFVDVGAEIGIYTCLAARLVGVEGRVFAFEPNPLGFGLLSRNVALNGFSNVTLFNKAVADAPGTSQFFSLGAHSTLGYSQIENQQGDISVEVVRLDQVLPPHGRVDLIKIDAEGSDLKVVRGMENTLRANKHAAVLIEYNPRLLRKAGHSEHDFWNELTRLGFSIYDVNNSRIRLNEGDLLARYPLGGSTPNLICLKESVE